MKNEIKKIISTNLKTVKASDSIHVVHQLMEGYSIRHLLVTDSTDTLVGIISKTDYLALKKVDPQLKQFCAQDLMSSPVKSVPVTAKINEVARYFIEHKISSVLVIEKGSVAGIVTSEDLLRLLADQDNISAEAEKMDLAALAEEGWISYTGLDEEIQLSM